MTLETLLLLQQCLQGQQLAVGSPDFPDVAKVTITALAELDQAITEAAKE